jgi:leader peptidase (prepilin peptidase) / N-methyltransferase
VESLAAIAAVTTGAVVGSFLNVCVHRLPLRRSVVHPRSACPACSAPIAWYDNVPIVSWVWLRGRCRACGAPISAQYPLVEGATALLFLLLLEADGPTPATLREMAFGAALIPLILIDAKHQILPNAITLPGIAAGLLTSPLRGAFDPLHAAPPLQALLESAQGAAVGFAIPYAINAAYLGMQALRGVPKERREDGIGRGDFKLLAMIGAFLGVGQVLFCLFAGAVSGSIFGLYGMARRGYGWKSKLPYGVFLGGAALLALFVGDRAVAWYLGIAGMTP